MSLSRNRSNEEGSSSSSRISSIENSVKLVDKKERNPAVDEKNERLRRKIYERLNSSNDKSMPDLISESSTSSLNIRKSAEKKLDEETSYQIVNEIEDVKLTPKVLVKSDSEEIDQSKNVASMEGDQNMEPMATSQVKTKVVKKESVHRKKPAPAIPQAPNNNNSIASSELGYAESVPETAILKSARDQSFKEILEPSSTSKNHFREEFNDIAGTPDNKQERIDESQWIQSVEEVKNFEEQGVTVLKPSLEIKNSEDQVKVDGAAQSVLNSGDISAVNSKTDTSVKSENFKNKDVVKVVSEVDYKGFYDAEWGTPYSKDSSKLENFKSKTDGIDSEMSSKDVHETDASKDIHLVPRNLSNLENIITNDIVEIEDSRANTKNLKEDSNLLEAHNLWFKELEQTKSVPDILSEPENFESGIYVARAINIENTKSFSEVESKPTEETVERFSVSKVIVRSPAIDTETEILQSVPEVLVELDPYKNFEDAKDPSSFQLKDEIATSSHMIVHASDKPAPKPLLPLNSNFEEFDNSSSNINITKIIVQEASQEQKELKIEIDTIMDRKEPATPETDEDSDIPPKPPTPIRKRSRSNSLKPLEPKDDPAELPVNKPPAIIPRKKHINYNKYKESTEPSPIPTLDDDSVQLTPKSILKSQPQPQSHQTKTNVHFINVPDSSDEEDQDIWRKIDAHRQQLLKNYNTVNPPPLPKTPPPTADPSQRNFEFA